MLKRGTCFRLVGLRGRDLLLELVDVVVRGAELLLDLTSTESRFLKYTEKYPKCS